MSGGHFDYIQWKIPVIAESIQEVIDNKGLEDGYEDEVIAELKRGIFFLELAFAYSNNIDKFVSGNTTSDRFRELLQKDIDEVREKHGREYLINEILYPTKKLPQG